MYYIRIIFKFKIKITLNFSISYLICIINNYFKIRLTYDIVFKQFDI